MHNRVFINSQGLPTYEAKDLGLAPNKYKNFPFDLSLMGLCLKKYRRDIF